MKMVNLLRFERGEFEENLCIIENDESVETVIQDWLNMPGLFIRRLRDAQGADEIVKMKIEFIKEFPYFSSPEDTSMLIGFYTSRESLVVSKIPMI